ncbi:MAG: nucleoside triphosphate pyrophosphohydrolase family protein [Thermoplasmatota archaeon]
MTDYRDLWAYQKDAARTLGGIDSERDGLALAGLGIAGEAGEVADLLKKHLFHGKPLDRDLLAKELGDVLWYLAACCEVAGLDLGLVASANMAKLAKRYPNGFNHADSAARRDLASLGPTPPGWTA